MLNNHITTLIKEKFEFEPTSSQALLMDGLGQFIMSEQSPSVCLIKGYAGTGKTSLMKAFTDVLDELKIPSQLMAPTGRAAKVLSSYTQKSAYTIHKMIYRRQSSNDDFGSFNLNYNKAKEAVFIVDEASMISNSSMDYTVFGTGRLLEDLLNFVFTNSRCKLIIIGDVAQLPPVGFDESPALDKLYLESLGMYVEDYFLSEVVRQEQDSGILYNASKLRFMLDDGLADGAYPALESKGYPDFKRLSGEELIDELNWCQENYGLDETLVVCRSNKRATLFNQGIRNSILYREEELTVTDHLLIMKNNYHWLKDSKEADFIANGDIAEVVRINGYEELYDRKFANVTIRLSDYEHLEIDVKIVMDALHSETAGFSKEEQEAFFKQVMEDYEDEKSQRKRYEKLKENPYYNALQVKYAYAMTCHKSQGGQWKAIFIDQGYIPEEHLGIGYFRWLYTAITRATERVYLVNFKDDFFED
ncbi:ATP-dependent RecD-like DNA helicase [Carboxylicivirga sp. M1479]|uniref:ATP-dependent DNA helicase n=1 Tax=Carboxylicivirga sp. M1479 TaxID=2594476 RepID=UPI00117822F6|nr:AAA family ATPase [Carboxylicivirga sp. M1479]TRX70945.1 AAA family ATPase [Carboxylicivirga sp. M1479]